MKTIDAPSLHKHNQGSGQTCPHGSNLPNLALNEFMCLLSFTFGWAFWCFLILRY